jgi:transposase
MVQPFRNERQKSWLGGIEGAFRRFGGVTEEVLPDNDRGLVARHHRATPRGRVQRPTAPGPFARHWGVRLRACALIGRAPTACPRQVGGKDERGKSDTETTSCAISASLTHDPG